MRELTFDQGYMRESPSAPPRLLTMNEIDEVSGGALPAVVVTGLVVGGAFVAGVAVAGLLVFVAYQVLK